MTSSKKGSLHFKESDPVLSIQERYKAIISRSPVFKNLKFRDASYNESLNGVVFAYHLRNSNVLEILFLKSEVCFRLNDFPWLPIVNQIKVMDQLFAKLDEMNQSYKVESTFCMMEIFLLLRRLKTSDLGSVVYKMRLDFCVSKCYDSLTFMGHGTKAKSLLEDARYWQQKDDF